MGTPINVTIYDESYIPNMPMVMVESIVLDQSQMAKNSKEDPHIDGDIEVSVSSIADYNAGVAATTMTATINMFLLHPVDSGIDSKDAFLFNSELMNYLNVFVVESSSPASTALLTANPYENLNPLNGAIFNDNDNVILKEKTRFQAFNLSDHISLNFPNIYNALQNENGASPSQNVGIQTELPLEKVTMQGAKEYYKIPFARKFEISPSQGGTQIDHLTYFAFCGVFPDNLETSLDLGAPDYSLSLDLGENLMQKLSMGEVVYELVIENGEVYDKQKVYFQNNGGLYFGPVHQMPDGSWMKGASHDGIPFGNPKLTEQLIPNFKIIDYRQKELLESFKFNFNSVYDYVVPSQSLIDLLENSKTKDLLKKNNTSFFSDLKLSRDINGACRFMFHLNMNDIALQNTVFPDFLLSLKTKSPHEYAQLIKKFTIEDIKVIRNRVKRSQVVSNVSEQAILSKYDAPFLVVRSNDQQNGRLQTSTYEESSFYSQNSRKSKSSSINPNVFKEAGTIAEIKLKNYFSDSLKTYDPVRTFSVVDYGVSRNNAGVYQYSIEIKIQDPVLEYFKTRLSLLKDASQELDTLISDLSHSSYNNFYSDRFNQKANEFYKQKYSPSFLPNIIGEFLSAVYLTVPETKHFTYAAIAQTMFLNNISNTNTGSISGMIFLGKMITDFTLKLEKLINNSMSVPRSMNSKGGSTANVPGIEESSPVFGSSGKRFFEISHKFKELFDIEDKVSYGYDFISRSSEQASGGKEFASAGLKIFNYKSIVERFSDETKKLFTVGSRGSSNLEFLVNGFSQEDQSADDKLNPGDTVGNKKFSFLSPSMIFLPRQNVFDSLKRSRINNSRDYSNLVIDIYNLNQRGLGYVNAEKGDISFRSSEEMDRQSQLKRIELVSLFSDKGCTIETTRELKNKNGTADEKTNPFAIATSQPVGLGFAGLSDIDQDIVDDLNLRDSKGNSKEFILNTAINTNRLMGSILMIDDFGMLKRYYTEFGPVTNSSAFYSLSQEKGGLTFKNEFLGKQLDPYEDSRLGVTLTPRSQDSGGIINKIKSGTIFNLDSENSKVSSLETAGGTQVTAPIGLGIPQRNLELRMRGRNSRTKFGSTTPSGRFRNQSNGGSSGGTTYGSIRKVQEKVADLISDYKSDTLGARNNFPLRDAPNHVKSLLAVFNNSGTDAKPSIVTEILNRQQDPFTNYEALSYILLNHRVINRIEVFRGFGGDNERVQNAIFSDLTEDDLINSNYRNGELILCRQVKYVNSNYAIENMDELSMPLLDEYFLIEPHYNTGTDNLITLPDSINDTINQGTSLIASIDNGSLPVGYTGTALGRSDTSRRQNSSAGRNMISDEDLRAMSNATGIPMKSVSERNTSAEFDTGGRTPGIPGTFASKYDNMGRQAEEATPQNIEGRRLNRSEPTTNQRGSGRGGY
jgi:hypothetical protein